MVTGWKGTISDVAVDSDTTTLETIVIREGAEYLWAEVGNSDVGNVFVSFDIQVQPHSTASFHTVASTASDFTTAIQEPLLGCSSDMTALGLGSTGLLWMRVKGAYATRFRAACNTASDAMTAVRWMVR